nr:short-chain dehydrogenase/reductase StrP [Stachybotrys sp.]
MPSYVITGVSRGIGWELLNQISSDPNNTVVGIVRNKPPTDKRVAEELAGRSNITILEAELTKSDDIKRAAAETAKITDGGLDYLVASAGQNMSWDALDPIGVLGEKSEELSGYFHLMMEVNVLANIHLYSAFIPLVLKGDAKKVVHLTSAMGDLDFARDYDLYLGSVYSAGKAAMNMVTTKFAAQYKKDGVLFLGICPGVVNTGQFDNITPEQLARFAPMMQTWQSYAPDFKGPISPEESVKAVLSVINNSSIEGGQSAAILSHFGNKQWL